MAAIHDNEINHVLNTVTKFFSYIVIILIIFIWSIFQFVLYPNIVDSMEKIIYICSIFFLAALTKLWAAELRPFMLGLIIKDPIKMEVYDCESDYGNPSSLVMVTVCAYYLILALFAEK